MNTIKLYAYYAVLGEKSPVYRTVDIPYEAKSEQLVEVPYELDENSAGEKLIKLSGEWYLMDQVLDNINGRPYLRWFDGQEERFVALKEI